MVDEITVNKICIARGMSKLLQSKRIPTWIDQNNQEGIELKEGRVVPFWNIDGGRNYLEPTGEKILKTIKLIEVEDIAREDIEEKHEAKTEENKTDKQKPNEISLTSNKTEVCELPEVLTPALMSKWAKMSTTDRILQFQQTPKNKIKSVAVGKDDKGIMQYAPYVEGNYMVKEANAAFLFDWHTSSFVLSICPTGVSAVGAVYGWFTEYQKYITRPATGYQEINKKVDVEQAKKGATTDAIKKGLSLFGFNSDVYSGEV